MSSVIPTSPTIDTDTSVENPANIVDANTVPTPIVRSSRFIPSAGGKGTYKGSTKFQPPVAKGRPGRAAARGR